MERIAYQENYDIVFCPLCNVNNKLDEQNSLNTCTKCGGFGFIVKERSSEKKTEGDATKESQTYLIR